MFEVVAGQVILSENTAQAIDSSGLERRGGLCNSRVRNRCQTTGVAIQRSRLIDASRSIFARQKVEFGVDEGIRGDMDFESVESKAQRVHVRGGSGFDKSPGKFAACDARTGTRWLP